MIKKLEDLKISDEKLEELWHYWALDWNNRSGEFEQVWLGCNHLSQLTGIEVKKLKEIMKFFIFKNIAIHEITVNADYMLCGSGIFLEFEYIEKSWEEIKDILKNND